MSFTFSQSSDTIFLFQFLHEIIYYNMILRIFLLEGIANYLKSLKGTCWHGNIYRGIQISCSRVPSGFDK